MTSKIANGQMFIQFPQPIAEFQDNPKPRVWVKLGGDEDDYYTDGDNPISLFVDNEALAKFNIGAIKQFSARDKWLISDNYYKTCVEKGVFVPIADLNETEAICKEKGYPPYLIDLGF